MAYFAQHKGHDIRLKGQSIMWRKHYKKKKKSLELIRCHKTKSVKPLRVFCFSFWISIRMKKGNSFRFISSSNIGSIHSSVYLKGHLDGKFVLMHSSAIAYFWLGIANHSFS